MRLLLELDPIMGRSTNGGGMKCPGCKAPGSGVIDSRPQREDRDVWRRRSCSACGLRWSTAEVIIKGTSIHAQPIGQGTPTNGATSPQVIGQSSPTNGASLRVEGEGGGLPSGSVSVLQSVDLSAVSKQSGSDAGARKSTPNAKIEPAYSAAFVEFWSLWPRKVQKGSAWAAWQAWQCDVRLPLILGVLAWQIPEDFDRRPMDRVPHAATWINGRGWENERPARQAPAVAPVTAAKTTETWDEARRRRDREEAARLSEIRRQQEEISKQPITVGEKPRWA